MMVMARGMKIVQNLPQVCELIQYKTFFRTEIYIYIDSKIFVIKYLLRLYITIWKLNHKT